MYMNCIDFSPFPHCQFPFLASPSRAALSRSERRGTGLFWELGAPLAGAEGVGWGNTSLMTGVAAPASEGTSLDSPLLPGIGALALGSAPSRETGSPDGPRSPNKSSNKLSPPVGAAIGSCRK